jgi:hypothetical protein
MYSVYCDNFLLYNDQEEGHQIFNSKLELELNKEGKFDFTIYNNHPNFDRMQRLKSIIQVFQDGFLLFRGRILNDEQGLAELQVIALNLLQNSPQPTKHQ